MKKYYKLIPVVLIFLFVHLTSFAQDDETTSKPFTPRWVSDKGFWMVESNIYSPRKYVIYFYNNNSELIYKEKIEGVFLDLKRRRVKMNLKRALEEALLTWEKKRKTVENESLVISRLQKRQ